MEKVPSCWEHMSVAWDELKSRKAEKSYIAAIWLDIAYACGLYYNNCWLLSLGDMVYQNTGCLYLLSVMRACEVSPGLIGLLLVATIT